MKKIILAETVSIVLPIIIFVATFRFVKDIPTAFAITFFALAAIVFVIVFAARAASAISTDLSTSLFIFAGPILVADVVALIVLTVTVTQITPVLFPFIIPNTFIAIIAFASAVFVLADAATIAKKSVVTASLLIETMLIIVGLTFVI